ncbi:recombinase family protein [Allomesorhizobium camelthorni]|uniref:Recombinase family protein n=1 Tax=Allomesorhizobium camelthorni TaxID=475069 RepID=A0A6G4WH88_9HYPH|nr:recombinase family protein [Mesorhizobium camelthorni]NGO53490.1 recombinase family protein [Mesorhizobium camelthorni]
MKKCFGYVRVSTVKQGEGVSLQAQREAIERFATGNNIIIIKWFEEKETAAKSGRPVFNAMIRLLKQRRADGVVMHKIDRSARNFADWAKIGDLADTGIDVHFATESLDFRSRGGRLAADIQAVIAADYIRNLREEIKKGIYGRLKQGLYPFGAPIGYLDQGSGKPKIPDPVRAPFIRQAFELYASGQHSLRSLLMELKRLGLRNQSGRPLSKGGLETILDNPFYCGLIRIRKNGETYQGIHQPLLSVQLFKAVQEIKAGKSGKKVTRHNHLYRGLFRCHHCDSAMTPERQKGHVYYRCQQRECATKCVREEVLETAVESALSCFRISDEEEKTLLQAFESWWKARQQTGTISTIKMQLGHINARIDRLTETLVDGHIDHNTYNQHKEKLLLEKLQAEEKLVIERKKNGKSSNLQRFLELIKSLANSYISLNPTEKREMVQITTSNRTVAGKSVVVEPSNWLLMTENAIAGLIGAPYRPTSRRLPELRDENIERLVQLAQSDEFARFSIILNSRFPRSNSTTNNRAITDIDTTKNK